MMVNNPFKDFEDFFEQPDVKKQFDNLRKEVASLKRSNTRLANRLRDIEILDTQSQVNNLSTQLGNVGQWLLHIRRQITRVDLRLEVLWISQFVGDACRLTPTKQPQGYTCIQQVRELGIGSIANLNMSTDPEAVFDTFYNRCKQVMTRFEFQDYFPP